MLSLLVLAASTDRPFRPPAVPLVTMSPYISVWSMADKLTDDWPRHWTGGVMGMFGMVRIDGKAYRWCGPKAIDVPAMEQVSVKVSFQATTYVFRAGGIELKVKFSSPCIDHAMRVPTDPLTQLTLLVESTDKKKHEITAYLDFTGEWCTNSPDEHITISLYGAGERAIVTMGSSKQPVPQRSGDRVRIDWGKLLLFTRENSDVGIGAHDVVRNSFAIEGILPWLDDMSFPKAANDHWPVAATTITFDPLDESDPFDEARFFIGYDEGASIEYFGRPLAPRRSPRAGDFRDSIMVVTEREDTRSIGEPDDDGKLIHEFKSSSPSPAYAQILALAYRQTIAGHGLVEDLNGDLLMFSKENTSNGCIGTVDVIFPACPFFLYFSPELMKANLRPVLDYASMPRWKFPFAPHDLGTYPKANGQVYGGGEKTEEDQMPVEETANMLLMMDAVARVEKNTKFAEKYDKLLAKWANYLLEKGVDPENQLCTDDFTGHLAHNANLSLKAIIALRAYADLLEMMGKTLEAGPFKKTAEQWAKDWVKAADDGDHFRLAFDKPGTWSMKYNLVWDRLLGFGLFEEVIAIELRFYAKQFKKYGLPLDSRATFTKGDWMMWTAALTSDKKEFERYADALYRMLDESPSRVPFTDWHDTITGETKGMYARTVVGGVFMKLLMDSGKLKRSGMAIFE